MTRENRHKYQNECERIAHRGIAVLAAALECDPHLIIGRFTPSIKMGRRYLSIELPDETTLLLTLEIEIPD